jgi:hypothetical protein
MSIIVTLSGCHCLQVSTCLHVTPYGQLVRGFLPRPSGLGVARLELQIASFEKHPSARRRRRQHSRSCHLEGITMVHVKSTSMAVLLAQVRRIPTPLAITIGVLVGLLIANMLPGNVSSISKFTDDNAKSFIAVNTCMARQWSRTYLQNLTPHDSAANSPAYDQSAFSCPRAPYLPLTTPHQRMHPTFPTVIRPASKRALRSSCWP